MITKENFIVFLRRLYYNCRKSVLKKNELSVLFSIIAKGNPCIACEKFRENLKLFNHSLLIRWPEASEDICENWRTENKNLLKLNEQLFGNTPQ